MGIAAVNFKTSTKAELKVLSAKMIGIFNRSHYEDVVAVQTRRLLPLEGIESTYDDINAFEKHLTDNGLTIAKFFLYISKTEPTKRLEEQLSDPTKRWKFSVVDGRRWDDVMEAYEFAASRCGTINGGGGSSLLPTGNGAAMR